MVKPTHDPRLGPSKCPGALDVATDPGDPTGCTWPIPFIRRPLGLHVLNKWHGIRCMWSFCWPTIDLRNQQNANKYNTNQYDINWNWHELHQFIGICQWPLGWPLLCNIQFLYNLSALKPTTLRDVDAHAPHVGLPNLGGIGGWGHSIFGSRSRSRTSGMSWENAIGWWAA